MHQKICGSREPHLCYMKQNQKPCITRKNVIDRGKRSKTLSEVKTVENINKNTEFSREKFRAKGSPYFTKLQNNAYE